MLTTVPTALDDDLLDAYARTAYGFGTYDADYWFVGIEQGSDGTCDEIARRLASWHARGRTELDDLLDYHRAIHADQWWTGSRPLQPTWLQLIRVLLTAQGQGDDTESIRRYQVGRLGRQHGETCLLELLPLPAKNTDAKSWPYPLWSRLPHLATRDRYMAHYTELRIAHIRARIREHAPKAVIFYGGGAQYQSWWKAIAGVPFQSIKAIDASIGSDGRTVFAIAMHPTAQAKGSKNDYFQRVGDAIRRAM